MLIRVLQHLTPRRNHQQEEGVVVDPSPQNLHTLPPQLLSLERLKVQPRLPPPTRMPPLRMMEEGVEVPEVKK